MTPECKKYKLDIACLKKPSALSKVSDDVPKPPGAIPNFGLPKWKMMPLESKIPMVIAPEGACNYTRGKVGENIWITSPDTEFNLSDPYCREIELNYDALHDRNLTEFFSRPKNAQFLVKVGLLTDDLDVKCSLKDYNMYRKYLRKLYCDGIKKELRRRGRLLDEKRILEYAEVKARKEAIKLRKRQKLYAARQRRFEKQIQEESEKHQLQKMKLEQLKNRLMRLEIARKEKQEEKRAIQAMHAACIRERLAAAAHAKRMKMVHTVIEWRKKETKRENDREKRLQKEQKEKHRLIEERWKNHSEFQERQIQKEQFLMECIQKQRERFLKQYNRNIQRERQRMQGLYKNARMFIKCYLRRRLLKNKKRVCCKKCLHSDEDKMAEIRKLVCSFDPSITTKDLEIFLTENPVKDIEIISQEDDNYEGKEQGIEDSGKQGLKTNKEIPLNAVQSHKKEVPPKKSMGTTDLHKAETSKKQKGFRERHYKKKFKKKTRSGYKPKDQEKQGRSKSSQAKDTISLIELEAELIDKVEKLENPTEHQFKNSIEMEEKLKQEIISDMKQLSGIPQPGLKRKCKCVQIKDLTDH